MIISFECGKIIWFFDLIDSHKMCFFLKIILCWLVRPGEAMPAEEGDYPTGEGEAKKKKKEKEKKKNFSYYSLPSFSPMHNHLKHQTHPQPIVWKGWQGNWWQRCRRGGRGGGGEAITGRRGAPRRPHLWRVEAGLQVHHHHHHWSIQSSSFSSS